MAVKVAKYSLSGNGFAEVYKVFGNSYYFAVVEMNGRYPERGKIAHDKNRSEYIYILEGVFAVKVNGTRFNLNEGEGILINDDDMYEVRGKGRALVFVHDKKNGDSKIEPLN